MRIQDHLIDRLTVARRWTTNLIADIDRDRWFEMPAGGVGHVAWQLGHLAVSQMVLIHVRCFSKSMDECIDAGLVKLLGRGSTPAARPEMYPPIDDIVSMFDRTQHEVIEMIRTMPDAAIEAPSAGDPHPMFSTKAGAIGMAAMHESFHAGQIAMMRRIWGKAPLR